MRIAAARWATARTLLRAIAGLRRVDDAPPVNFLRRLRFLPLERLDGVGAENPQLHRVLNGVRQDGAVGPGRPYRRWPSTARITAGSVRAETGFVLRDSHARMT